MIVIEFRSVFYAQNVGIRKERIILWFQQVKLYSDIHHVFRSFATYLTPPAGTHHALSHPDAFQCFTCISIRSHPFRFDPIQSCNKRRNVFANEALAKSLHHQSVTTHDICLHQIPMRPDTLTGTV